MRFITLLMCGVAGGSCAASSTLSCKTLHNNSFHTEEHNKSGLVDKYRLFTLGEVLNLTEEVAVFRFLFGDPNEVYDLPACTSVMACYMQCPSVPVERHYMPITPHGKKGHFDIVVKKRGAGRMTETLFSMKVGDRMKFKKFFHKFEYHKNKWDRVGMICAGVGVVNMLQVLHQALPDPVDRTTFSMIYANKTPKNIVLKGILDEYQRLYPHRFNVEYIVDSPFEPKQGGHVRKRIIAGVGEFVEPVAVPQIKRHHSLIRRPQGGLPYPLPDPSCDDDGNDTANAEEGDQLAAAWDGHVGYVDDALVARYMPPPPQDEKNVTESIVLVAGNDMFMKDVAGCPWYHMQAMRGNNTRYGSHMGMLNNVADVTPDSVFGRLGYRAHQVFRF